MAAITGPCGVDRATHAAWEAGTSGYNFTAGNAADALGCLVCPSRGMVSVWKAGTIPNRHTSKIVPWILVRGEGCSIVKLWPGAPAWLGEHAGVSGIGIDVPKTPWIPTGHAWLDTWISTVAAAYGAPQLLVGLLCLGACSAALCSKLRVDMYVNTLRGKDIRWSEPIGGLYTMGVCPSGLRKTPMLEHLLAPWRRMQQMLSADARKQEARWEIRVQRAVARVAKLSKQDKANHEAGAEDERLIEATVSAKEPPPRDPALIIGSGTGPALGIEMTYQAQVLLATSEATELFKALLRDDVSDIENLLKGYAGEPPGATARVSRKQPIATAYRCAVVAMTQPSGLHGVGESLSVKGQGLFARFLWVGASRTEDCEGVIDADLQRQWDTRILALLRRAGPVRDAWGVESGTPTLVCVSPAQTARVLAMEKRLRLRADTGGDLYGIDTWTRKAHGQACRIAAVLSSLDVASNTVEDRYLDWALYIVEHVLLAHAQYIAQVMSWPPGTEDATHLYTIAATHLAANRHTFALTELDKWVPQWSTEQTDMALTALANRGYVTIHGKQRADRLVTFKK